jgi:hypothetical protein
MDITNTLIQQEQYIKENNYKKTCATNLYCCQLSFYKNTTHYLQHFVCYFYGCQE